MSDQDDARAPRSSAEEGIERLYESLGALVLRTLTRRFAVPPQEAQKLAYEILVEYVTRSAMVDDPKECLMAMTGESAWTWQRRNGLAALPETVREMVRLRVEKQRTYPEIAAEMGVTAYYVEAAVEKALETLRKVARSRGK